MRALKSGTVLRKSREKRNFSLEYVSERLGISVEDIEDIENSKRELTASEIGGFARCYGIMASDIVEGKTPDYYSLGNLARLINELNEEDFKLVMFNIEYFRHVNKDNGGNK